MIRQVAHINFMTDDLDRMIDFYVNKLGLNVKFSLKNKEGQPFGYYFDCRNSTFIEVFDQKLAVEFWGGEVKDLVPGSRYKHVCFEVTGLDEYCELLKHRGVKVTGNTLGMDHSRQAWIKDPDGNDIELMEYSPDSLQLTGAG